MRIHGTAWQPSCAYSKQDILPAVSIYDDFSLSFLSWFFTSANEARCLQSNLLSGVSQQDRSGFLIALAPFKGCVAESVLHFL